MYKYFTVSCFLLCGLSTVKCFQKDVQSESTDLIDEIKRLRSELLEIRKEFTYKISDALEDKLLPIRSSIERSRIKTQSSIDQLKEQTQQSFEQLKIGVKSSMLQLQQDITSLNTSCVLNKEEIQKYSPVNNMDQFKEEMKTTMIQLQQGIISLNNSSASIKEEIQRLSPIKLTIDHLKDEVKSSILQLQKNITSCCPSNGLVEDRITNMTSDGNSNSLTNLKAGSHCTWNGVNGTCIHSRRCLSTLGGEKHIVCSGSGAELLVCCTDCVLYNDISNAELNPVNGEGIFWKDGSQASHYNLEHLDKLPYKCRNGKGFKRYFDEEKQCHMYELRSGDSNVNKELLNDFPYQVLLGEGSNPQAINWQGISGTIISERFILTAAGHARRPLTYVAMGMSNLNHPPEKNWQLHEIKRRILHPEYIPSSSINDIALLETKTKIHFNKYVQPACLPSEELSVELPLQTVWWEKSGAYGTYEICNVIVYAYFSAECTGNYGNYNPTTQMCFGHPGQTQAFWHNYGDRLVVKNDTNSCKFTVAGLSLYGSKSDKPNVYTRVFHYVCWIASIVWP